MKLLLIFILLAFADLQGGEHCQWAFKNPPPMGQIAEIRAFPHYPPKGMAPCKKGWCPSKQGNKMMFKTHIYQRKDFKSHFGEDLIYVRAFLDPPTYEKGPYKGRKMFEIGDIVEIRWIGPKGGLFFFNQFQTELPLFRGRACNSLW